MCLQNCFCLNLIQGFLNFIGKSWKTNPGISVSGVWKGQISWKLIKYLWKTRSYFPEFFECHRNPQKFVKRSQILWLIIRRNFIFRHFVWILETTRTRRKRSFVNTWPQSEETFGRNSIAWPYELTIITHVSSNH